MAIKMMKKKLVKKSSGSASCCAGKSLPKVSCGDLNKMIQDRAYFIWEAKGKPAGQDRECWLQAEKEIRTKCK